MPSTNSTPRPLPPASLAPRCQICIRLSYGLPAVLRPGPGDSAVHADLRDVSGGGLVGALHRAARTQSPHPPAIALHGTGCPACSAAEPAWLGLGITESRLRPPHHLLPCLPKQVAQEKGERIWPLTSC